MTEQVENSSASQDLSKAADASGLTKPPPPTITYPTPLSEQALGRVVIAGRCERGATVIVYDFVNNYLANATVSDGIWYFSRVLDAGIQHVQVRQTLGGVQSEPDAVRFYVGKLGLSEKQPHISSPNDGSSLPAGMVRIRGSCPANTSEVRVRAYDGTLLGIATRDGTFSWSYERIWERGDKHIKVTQIYRDEGGEYGPTSIREFKVV